MNTLTSEKSEPLPLRYTALEYRPQDLDPSSPDDARTIVLALRLSEDALEIFIRPDWKSGIPRTDGEYIEALLLDFRDRAQQDPERLFEQISKIGVGPLVTRDTGMISNDKAQVTELLRGFVKI